METPPVDPQTPPADAWQPPKLTLRRLSGLDRSGPLPPATQPGAPLHVWTIPNAIGFVRLALLPVFVVWAWRTDSGTDAGPAVLYGVIAWSDYFDGMAARVTGQYSRFGTILDPFVDRLLVASGVTVCWHFDLLPRWLLAIMLLRELLMLLVGQYAVRHHMAISVSWTGRCAVLPTMSSIFFGLCGLETLATVLLIVGASMSIVATWQYARRITAILAEPEPST